MRNGSLLGVTILLGATWWQACGDGVPEPDENATSKAIQEEIASEIRTPDHIIDPKKHTLEPLTKEEILEIAAADARKAYRDLSIYDVTAQVTYEINAQMTAGIWDVDYVLKNPTLNGGGPHYRIHSLSGEILEKRYEQ
jgi:hypothetical protein